LTRAIVSIVSPASAGDATASSSAHDANAHPAVRAKRPRKRDALNSDAPFRER
jgi:hypothetical protein